jgi:hypothetical protein
VFSLTFEEKPEVIAKEAAIHELHVPPVTVRSVIDLLERMGLTERIEGLVWYRDLNWITASDDKVTVSCNEVSGGLQYRLRPLADESGRDVADDSTVESIAREYLKRIGRPNEEQPLHLERVTHLHSQTADAKGKSSTPSKLDAGVIFTRKIDELPVVGTGGFAMVKIGTDNAVVGGREVWRPIARSGSKVALRSAAEAMDLLETKLKRVGLDGDYYVCKAWQCYHESGIEEVQRHLEPCYLFVVESFGKQFDTKKGVVIPAARVGPMASSFTT